jgi:hypothetical protein
MRKIRSKLEKANICPEWASSGLSKVAYCKAQGIAVSSLWSWSKETKKEEAAVKFLPISNNEKVLTYIEIILPNEIRFKVATDRPFWVELIKGLIW